MLSPVELCTVYAWLWYNISEEIFQQQRALLCVMWTGTYSRGVFLGCHAAFNALSTYALRSIVTWDAWAVYCVWQCHRAGSSLALQGKSWSLVSSIALTVLMLLDWKRNTHDWIWEHSLACLCAYGDLLEMGSLFLLFDPRVTCVIVGVSEVRSEN